MKNNVLASYASQIYVTFIGIVMVPMYVRYMGTEAYGLVGFFAMLQAWFQLLDMGLTPTMARETARFNGGATDASSLRRLLRALEGIFVGVAVVGGLSVLASAGPISKQWLNVQHLPISDVKQVVMLMGGIVSLRWISGLYRGAINGFERLVWLSSFNSAIATARFVMVIPLFTYVGTAPFDFFAYQLIVAVLELLVLVAKTYRLLPKMDRGNRTVWEWAPLRGVLKFSLSIAFTSSVWIMVTQTDKLVLSKLLSLSEYAYFSLAVLVASGINAISGPISGALLPRLTRLSALNDDAGLVLLYRTATRWLGVICIPAALVLSIFSQQVLWAWTGNLEIVSKAAPVLSLYALGNGILALAAFPYYLQFAKGDLRLHLIGNGIFLVLLIPGLIAATFRYGVIGAGYAWLAANVVYFLIWVPKVHRRFFKNLHSKWIFSDIGVTLVVTLIGALIFRVVLVWPQDRISVAIRIAAVSLTLLAVAAGSTFNVTMKIKTQYCAWRAKRG